MQHRNFALLQAGVLALVFVFSSVLRGQGSTTSSLGGFVTDAQGKPVAGAAITVRHEPSGTISTAATRQNGQYDLSGLHSGGPYSVIVRAGTQPEETRSEIYLDLGERSVVNVKLGAGDVVRLEAFKVESSRDTVFDSGKIGTGTSITSGDVENLPSVRRNIQDIAVLDTRVVLLNLSNFGEMSAQGQNYRYNSFLVDNVQTNDPYGLNANGFGSLRSPIPFEAIQAVSVELNPYNVRRGGFTGALTNAVVKSGTNKLTGVVYGEYTDQYMRAKNPVSQAREVFRERVYGVAVGGPIIPGKLFYFFSYDDFRRQTPPPTLTYTLDAGQVAQIVARARSFGYEPGNFSGAENLSLQKTYIGKIDWNINTMHRMSVTYRRLRGTEPQFPFFGGTSTSFSNFWYDTNRKNDSITAQLFSNWTPNFRTEASFSSNKYDGTASNHGKTFPQVFIQGLTALRVTDGVTVQTGTVNLGTNATYQQNSLLTKTQNGALSGEYSLGDHTLSAGADFQQTLIDNDFVTNAIGSYTFRSLGDWLTGTNATFTQSAVAPGKTLQDVFANFTYTTLGLYAQDLWKPSSRLTLTAGIRFDVPYVSRAPTTIPTTATYSEALFQSSFGRRSNTTNDGNYTISPRVGFSYNLDTGRKTQVRGGLGLFQGTNPAVWLANAYQNRGLTQSISVTNATFTPTPPANVGNPAVAIINLTNPGFHSPALWKGNLAIDHQLPFGGLIFTAELGGAQTKYAVLIRDLNLKQVGVNPDGRIRYAGAIVASSTGNARGGNGNSYSNSANYQNAGFADVYELGNTSKGGGYDFTLKLTRPLRNNWSASLAWTHSDYKDVSPMTATGIAQSFYYTRAVLNPNDDTTATSNYNIPNRIVGQLTYRFHLLKKAPTTISLVYQGRTGRPYSWVFAGDANGDGFTFNDRFYVPSGPNDPAVRWNSTAERDNFFTFVNSSNLNKYRGTVAPRNTEHSLWVNTLDLKFTQRIPLYQSISTELYANVLNLCNLLNRRWGLVQEMPFSYKRGVAGATFDAANNQYVYTFTPSTLDPAPITADGNSGNSRWQVQVGMRVRF